MSSEISIQDGRVRIDPPIPQERPVAPRVLDHARVARRHQHGGVDTCLRDDPPERITDERVAEELEAIRSRLWLEAELAIIKPAVVVVLGATAAQAVLGASFRVTEQRGKIFASELAPSVLATVHPSSILRATDDKSRRLEFDRFVADLRVAGNIIHSKPFRRKS